MPKKNYLLCKFNEILTHAVPPFEESTWTPRRRNTTFLKKAGAGFTLIELLIVIAILGGLAAVVTVAYPASQRRARDAQRKSDLKQYQIALETFANANNGLYPSSVAGVRADSILCVIYLTLSNCPPDPADGESVCGSSSCRYFYWGSATQYVLWGALEQPMANDFWVVCSNGRSGESAIVPTSSTCPAF
ncbi:type II secretion system GspH family protein [Patescibacteria group bacterium]|nr:type II secretion system GspH family protein [Patescibacteria group bacterium]